MAAAALALLLFIGLLCCQWLQRWPPRVWALFARRAPLQSGDELLEGVHRSYRHDHIIGNPNSDVQSVIRALWQMSNQAVRLTENKSMFAAHLRWLEMRRSALPVLCC